jgi:multidrug efflux pump subunit AcrA (membrane-fusion protein)
MAAKLIMAAATAVSGIMQFQASRQAASAQRYQAELARKQGQQQARVEMLRLEQNQVAKKGAEIAEIDNRIRRRRAAMQANRQLAATYASRGFALNGSGTYTALLDEQQTLLYQDLDMLRMSSAETHQALSTQALGQVEAAQGALRTGELSYRAGRAQAGASMLSAWGDLAQTGLETYRIGAEV